jgi:hypothetical protein
MAKHDQPCPNPLFVSMLEKWVEEARTEGNKNKEFTYQKVTTLPLLTSQNLRAVVYKAVENVSSP